MISTTKIGHPNRQWGELTFETGRTFPSSSLIRKYSEPEMEQSPNQRVRAGYEYESSPNKVKLIIEFCTSQKKIRMVFYFKAKHNLVCSGRNSLGDLIQKTLTGTQVPTKIVAPAAARALAMAHPNP